MQGRHAHAKMIDWAHACTYHSRGVLVPRGQARTGRVLAWRGSSGLTVADKWEAVTWPTAAPMAGHRANPSRL